MNQWLNNVVWQSKQNTGRGGKKTCLYNFPCESSLKTCRVSLADQKMTCSTSPVSGEVTEWKDWHWVPHPIMLGVNSRPKALIEKWWQQTD